MSRKNWTREDVVNWLRECGCEEESNSIHDEDMFKATYDTDNLLDSVSSMNGIDSAMCPETYQKVANTVCQDPYAALEAIKPVMQQIGVGCPQSFAQALVDVFTVAQENSIIKPFNTEIV